MKLVNIYPKDSGLSVATTVDSMDDIVIDPIENALIINTSNGYHYKAHWPNIVHYLVSDIPEGEDFDDLFGP